MGKGSDTDAYPKKKSKKDKKDKKHRKRSSDESQRKSKQRKEHKKKQQGSEKDQQERGRSRQNFSREASKGKDLERKDKKKEKSKERSYSRDRKKKEKSKERSYSRDRKKKESKPREEKDQQYPKNKNRRSRSNSSKQRNISPIVNDHEEEDRIRKIRMRKVKAALLKYNDHLLDSSSEQQGPKAPQASAIQPTQTQDSKVVPPKAPQPEAAKPKVSSIKKASKWNKTSSSQPMIPVQKTVEEQRSKQDRQLSLEPDASEDQLKLSEDKSVQYDNYDPGQGNNNLEVINEEEIDPLDAYMQEIEGDAVQQIRLAKKGKVSNVITYEDVIKTNTQSELPNENKDEEEFRKEFMEAISNIEEVKKHQKNDSRGTMMENHEEKESDMEDFHEEKETELDFFAKQRKMAERKELGQVDHSKITYEEVRFNLYRQADEIRNMNPKQVNKYRKEAGDIKIRGKDILNPVFNWYHCGFSDRILSVIEKRNYSKPFPIQAQSLPLLLSGRDVIGIAETGSGKTLAYLLPALRHIMDQRPVDEGEGPISIVMCPTRELARQVYSEAKVFCRSLNIRVLAVYGGLSVQNQLSEFRKGCELVICTPGRMIDILTLNKGKITNLKRVTMIIIDEADRMFDLGFEPQISKIVDNVRPNKQFVMFSATFPKNVEILARRILKNPVEIIVGGRGQACRNVEQIIEVREENTKFLRLLQILGLWNEKGSILIFVDKQTEVDYLFQQLLKYGYHALSLHGAMDPDDREFTIYDYKKGLKNIMVATSVCARGLDIKSIVLVINFICPNHLEDYIHRIGRTGRAGNKGTAITFITPAEQKYSIDLLKALEMSEIHPPQELIQLSQSFLAKVKKGEARRIRNMNIKGIGFKFDQDEEEKANQLKDMLKKQMKTEGIVGFQDSDDDDIELKKKKEENMRGRNDQERIAEAIKNPEIKNKLLNEAVKAVSDAIKEGEATTTEKLLQIAVGSMKQAVSKHKVIRTVNDGVEQVTKLINQFQNKSGQNPDLFSYDFQINDYPQAARQKACNQQFLYGIQNQTNCAVSLLGVYVEGGKKPPVGCRKLYLHIQGENKYYVKTAYNDIKSVLEQSAYESMHMGGMINGKFSIGN